MAAELLEKKNIRLDLYLFYIRIFKSRNIATKYILSNRLRLSGQVTKKPDKLISIGNVLTLLINHKVKTLEVLQIPKRRGPSQWKSSNQLSKVPEQVFSLQVTIY